MPLFRLWFIPVTLYDLADIAIVAGIIFGVIRWLKGTRAAPMFAAVLVLVLISLLADWWHLNGLRWIMSNLKTLGLVAFFIVFQPEIRSALTRLGQFGLADIFFKKQRGNVPVELIVRGALELSKQKLGGLIIIEKKVGLRNVLETGKPLDAEVTPELLATIFSKHSPLHDGAVVVRGGRIAAAACVLPLLQNPGLAERQFGMRHRAGLGIAAESDAVALIVSEETGGVSIASGIDFVRQIPAGELKAKIQFFLRQ